MSKLEDAQEDEQDRRSAAEKSLKAIQTVIDETEKERDLLSAERDDLKERLDESEGLSADTSWRYGITLQYLLDV